MLKLSPTVMLYAALVLMPCILMHFFLWTDKKPCGYVKLSLWFMGWVAWFMGWVVSFAFAIE